MKKSLSMIAIIFIGWAFLWAIPQPLHKVYVSKDKKDPFGVDCFHLEGNIAYCVDNSRGIIKAWDINQQAFLQTIFIKLPLGVKANDLSGDENSLYILDSKASAIHLYNYEGKYLRTISTKESPDIRFIKAIRILVNYQGYIFVLDAGRNELLAFTNEGMFLGKVPMLAPISMCLGQDQIIRILVNKDKTQAVIPIEQNLDIGNSFVIATPDNKVDQISDIAINQYNELYVIYSMSTKIGKVDASGKLISRSTWGSKDKSESLVSFQQPAVIKAIPYYDNVLIGILDSTIRTLKLYQDSDFSSKQTLEVPQLTLRPKLIESTEPQAIDYCVYKDRKYIIHNKTVQYNNAKITTETISCIQNDTTLFNIYAVAEAKKGVQGYSALALYNDKLFVLDTKAAKVFVYNNLTGNYIESFAGKGSQNGHLKSPKSISVDFRGLIYIADWGNCRIAIFDENTAHIHNIDLKAKELKPQLLRISGQNLYFLANDSFIYQMSLDDDSNLKMVANAEKISTFDILYEDRLGYIDGIKQQLNIIYNNNCEHRFFSKNNKGLFPGFANINLIRYNPYNKTLYICDKMAKNPRLLTFYYSPKKPQTIFFTVNKAKHAELSWEVAEGISNWLVTEKRSTETKTYQVKEPHFIVYEPQREICTYIVQAVSADNKAGPPSEEIEDAYSYARYLSLNKHYAEAVQALQLASKTFSGMNFEDEMVQNFQQEARLYVSQNEFEKALNSIDSVEKIVGVRIDTSIQKAEIYKMMNDYKQGIAHLEKFKNLEDKGILRELISLYYLDNNYGKVKELCNSYFSKFNRDTDILRYQIYAEEKMMNYSAALNSMRDLITREDNLDNNIKMGELLILNKDYEAALNSLQRTLNRFNNQGADVIQKLMGDCYFAAGNYAYAVDKYLDALRLNSEVAEYYYCLGRAYTENRKAREATESFALAYQRVPIEVKYGFAYAQALDKELRYPEALAVMDNIYQYVSSDSSSTAYHEFYHDLLIKEHRYDDAWREIQIALNYAPDNTTLHEKAVSTADTRRYYNENRDEIEIKKYEFYKLYPALIGYYQTHPIGTITLFNTRNISIEHITVSVTIPQITDRPFQTIIPTLMAGAELPVDIIVPVNRNIFELSKNGLSTFAVDMQVDWVFNNKPKSAHKNAVIQSQGINSMDWNERKQYACFVNPSDENLRNFVTTQIIQLFTNQPTGTINKNIQRAVQIWSFYSANGIKYVSDISSANLASSETDYVQFPFQTLSQKAGDCDDLLVLLASTLSVIGIQCGFLDIPGHVMLVMDTGMNAEDILSSGLELSQFIFRNGKYWLPVESTLLGKETFTTSWNEAVKHYNLLIGKDIYPELMEFDTIHSLYPPAPYTTLIPASQFGKNTEAVSLYAQDLANVTLMGTLSKEEEFITTLKKYPSNLNVINRYALWCLENKRPEKAYELWSQMLSKYPQNLAALINLGNLQLSNNNFDAARHNYLEALKQNKNTDLILRNLCILEYNCGNQLQAREYFNRMSDRTLLKKVNPQIYFELLNTGE